MSILEHLGTIDIDEGEVRFVAIRTDMHTALVSLPLPLEGPGFTVRIECKRLGDGNLLTIAAKGAADALNKAIDDELRLLEDAEPAF